MNPEPNKTTLAQKLWYGFIIFFLIAVFVIIVYAIHRYPIVKNRVLSEERVVYIKSFKLDEQTMQGTNIPIPPNEEINNSTVNGIDSNNNYIRDDIEVYIYQTYNKDRPTRLAALQYAQSLYLEQFAFDNKTFEAVLQSQDAASMCVFETLVPISGTTATNAEYAARSAKYDNVTEGVESLHVNSELRKEARKKFSSYVAEGSMGFSLPGASCPIILE
jgi:hypothetical protein